MQFTAAQIAMLINGKIEGDANASVNSFGTKKFDGERLSEATPVLTRLCHSKEEAQHTAYLR